MPHQCVRCRTIYEDGSSEILKGCSCGAKLFFFVRKDRLEKSHETIENLSDVQVKQIELDVRELIGQNDPEEPVILDIESIKIIRPGKYELDIVQLFKGEPLVYKVEEGKYIVDVAESLKVSSKKVKY